MKNGLRIMRLFPVTRRVPLLLVSFTLWGAVASAEPQSAPATTSSSSSWTNAGSGTPSAVASTNGTVVRTLAIVEPDLMDSLGRTSRQATGDPQFRAISDDALAAIHAALSGPNVRIQDHAIAGTPFAAALPPFNKARFTQVMQRAPTVKRSEKNRAALATETIRMAEEWHADAVLFTNALLRNETRSQKDATTAAATVGLFVCCLIRGGGGGTLSTHTEPRLVHLALVDGKTGAVLWERAQLDDPKTVSVAKSVSRALGSFTWP